jgi:hypothetical protein
MQKINFTKIKFLNIFLFFFLVLPASTNYKLKDYGFGNGGEENMASTNYAMEAITGEVSGQKMDSASYGIGAGLIYTNQADVPGAPTFSNPSNYYNKLQIILNTASNPTDTKYAIAISKDNFVTTQYVQSDNTVGASLGAEDYQVYSSWGSGSGVLIIGLLPNTTYKVKVKAIQGKFTETGYGPVATAATINPTLSFDMDVSATDSETDPPFSITFGNLMAGTVMDSPEKIWVDFSTNGETGGKVYVIAQNGGLLSSSKGYTISAVSGDLAALAQGFGAQGSSATQSAGGPLTIATLYNQTGSTVGITDSTVREMFSSSNPIANGRGSFILKAKSASTTPAANDYKETFTVIASGSF